jgi:outer membrane protein TolC
MNNNITAMTLAACVLTVSAGAAAVELEGPSAPAKRSISLAETQQLAARRNPSMKDANERVYQADMMIYRAWSMLLPHLSANGSIVRNQDEIALAFPDFSAFDPADPAAEIPMDEVVIQELWGQSFGFSANMTLFNPRSIPLIKNAGDSADLSRLAAQVQRNDVLFAVTSAYYQVHSMRQLIDVADENVVLAEELVRVSTARKRAGQGIEVDVLRAEIQLTRAQKALADAKDAHAIAKTALAHLTGIEGAFDVAGPEQVDAVDGELAELTDRALVDRVEVDAAALERRIARRSRSETLMKWLPVFDVTYNWSWNSAAGFSGEHDQWTLIFGASWSLFEGGGRIAEAKARQSQMRMAENRIDQLRLDIRAEVERAYLEANRSKRNVDLAEKQTELAERNHSLISEQYRVGLTTSLDALDSATELSNQRVSRVVERLRYDIALLALSKSVGEYSSLAPATPID